LIIREATHAVILAGDRDREDILKWEDFCRNLNLRIIVNLDSNFQGKEDKINTVSPLLTASIHYLARGEDVSSRPMVQSLAQLLVDLCRG
jgi:CRISPR-associated protein Csx3